ncbi:MAG: HicB family protein [Firmicutes bacterium]|jgi:predicted RNase H-like HicB family nuclease|nr:HicB family protein [Bacillota bacterium]
MKAVYPVIFTPSENVILIEVPDLEILTEGESIVNAIDMARDAIGLKIISLEYDKTEIPNPTNLFDINIENSTFAEEGKSYVSMVDVDITEYRKKVDNKSVRRNITLPNWLNIEAEKAHINVSKVAQEALMEKLGVSR